ncbi:hypothetical protein NPIL_115671 [Nephila pilipes]|uniref:Uncharacterized protein n=1 Tax=Nephila pilipes TaxID=299642 RepID=A0A8X6UJE7_NEPPI|nr:hypothetical protein NPIL_115671 [Nephila pilipes]
MLCIRNTTPSEQKTTNLREYPSKPYAPKRSSPDSRFDKTNQAGSTSSFSRGDKLKIDNKLERSSKDGANFQKTRFSMSLADNHKSEMEVYTTSEVIRLEGRVIRSPLTVLPYAKGNQTLLGMNFLQKSGIVLNLKQRNWFLSDSPNRTYDFVKEVIV